MANPAKLCVGRMGETYVVRVEGYGSMWESHALAAAIGVCRKEGAEKLAVDLSACVYLDSTFLGHLLMMHRQVQANDQQSLQIVADELTRQQLFGATHLDRVLRCISQLDTSSVGDWVTIERSEPDSIQFGRHSAKCHRELGELGGPESEKFLRIADRLERELESATL